MKFRLSLVLAAFVLSSCGGEGSSRLHDSVAVTEGVGIIGGEPVESDDLIATQTALLIDIYSGFTCTASILNDEWLLTAANCVVESRPSALRVAFTGSYDDFRQGLHHEDVREVEKYYVPSIFYETLDQIREMEEQAFEEGRPLPSEKIHAVRDWGDIALIRIKGKIPASKTPVAISDAAISLEEGQRVVLAGYGRRGIEGDAPWGELHKVTVAVADPEWGQSEFLLYNNDGRGACFGDSGGPVYVYADGRYYLFGLISRRMGGMVCDHFSVSTSILSHSEWIQSILAAYAE